MKDKWIPKLVRVSKLNREFDNRVKHICDQYLNFVIFLTCKESVSTLLRIYQVYQESTKKRIYQRSIYKG